MKKNITALIKPASSLCNMDCTYCFYRDTAKNRKQYSYGIMNREVVDQLIEKTLSFAEGGLVTYCFQGGEPLLVGIEFYEYFVSQVEKKNQAGSKIIYSVQTNGTNLSEEFCKLFREKEFLLGVSLDGPRDVHDYYRYSLGHEGTFDKVMEGIALLRKYEIEFNILSVVTAYSAKYIKEIWEFFKQQGFSYLQFIPCLEPIGTIPFQTGFAMDNEQYYQFQKQLFDLYWRDLHTKNRVFVRHLDNIMARLYGGRVEQCDMIGRCLGQLVIEADGSIYPCDFYCEDKYLLGNIVKMGLKELEQSAVMRQFIKESFPIEEDCKNCLVLGLCRGGCRRERDVFANGVLQKNIYCEGRKKFFLYIINKLKNNKKNGG